MINKLIKGKNLCIGALLCASILSACHKEPQKQGPPQAYAGGLVFTMAENMPQYIMPNAEAYVFDGLSNEYAHKLLGVTKQENIMSAKIEVGAWNMVLLSRNNSGTGSVVPPVPGATMEEAIMWKSTAVSGFIPQMPELYYARTGAINVLKDVNTNASANLVRNMARVRLVVVEGYDFATGTNAGNTITVSNVPTTLSWAGKLLPSKTKPDVSAMRNELKFNAPINSEKFQRSDTVDFVIPAHRGFDWELNEPTDTVMVNLMLSVNLTKASGASYVKENVPLRITPKMNHQMVVNILIRENITVGPVVVSPWAVNDISGDPY